MVLAELVQNAIAQAEFELTERELKDHKKIENDYT